MGKMPVKKKGYAARYVRYQLGKNRMLLLLGLLFLFGVLLGANFAGNKPEVLSRLTESLAQAQDFHFISGVTTAFATNALFLLVICLCGFGAIFQPIAAGMLLFKGIGIGVLGVYAYASAKEQAILYYLLVLLPDALFTALILIAAVRESLRFSLRFFSVFIGKDCFQKDSSGGAGVYLAEFLVFYLLSGTAALLVGILKLLFYTLT